MKNKDDVFVLNTTFGAPFKEIIAEKLTVKVVLPEGAYGIRTELPFEVMSEERDTKFSYLDT